MSSAGDPKSWREFIPSFAWGSLVFTCGLDVIEKVVEQSYGQALLAFTIGLVLALMALHSETWISRTNPNWIFPAALLVVLTLERAAN